MGRRRSPGRGRSSSEERVCTSCADAAGGGPRSSRTRSSACPALRVTTSQPRHAIHRQVGEPGWYVTRSVAALRLDVIVELGYTGYGLAAGVPFVMPVHDIQHRLQPEFPEVGSPDEWAARDAFLTRALAAAAMILVDSEVGRTNILEHYGEHIGADRIAVLPFIPSPYLEQATLEAVAMARVRYGLPGRYLLFPAQFWPHKNHLRVIEALALPECEDLQVVMTGGAGDEHRDRTMAEVREAISRHGLGKRTRILGHVPDGDMSALYSGSAGVILPTFFGPTNIPVVEAWSLGIPVLTSDIPGIREQAGDAAVLVDPRSVEAIAHGMATLWQEEGERVRLIKAGTERVRSWTSQDFADALAGILDEVQRRLAA